MGVWVVKYVLRFKLRFSDTWKAQIETIGRFLTSQAIRTSNVQHESTPGQLDAYRIDVGALESVLQAGKQMLPYCVKKAEDLRIMIDYMEGRITGSQAIERLNEEVRIGRRSGIIRTAILPNTRGQGLRIAQLENAKTARAAYAVHVDHRIHQIRLDHQILKLGYIRLGKKYGYSTKVIRRILGAP